MILNKSELKVGLYIINEKPHFKYTSKITKVTDNFVHTDRGTAMPIDFYLNKSQFTVKTSKEWIKSVYSFKGGF